MDEVTEQPIEKARAHPTKAFFVRMLTRDISLEDCILDLIDNAVDAAWASADATPTKLESGTKLADAKIEIEIDDAHFTITDNCGGISLDNAVNYAFTFGREVDGGPSGEYSVGVYGIGMKRSIFKIGNVIRVTSTHVDDGSFFAPINVQAWMEDEAQVWDFNLYEADPLPSPGVSIQVEELGEETSASFSDPAFTNRLKNTISRDYLLPLMQGLTIQVNGSVVKGWEVEFRASDSFQPMREIYHEGDVTVEIIAGMSSTPPTSTDPSDRSPDRRSGWYVLCNGRVVVAADRSSLTVWGNGKFPSWHPQYEGFVGVVLFSSPDPSLLPMTTTKNSVDTSSGIYRRSVAKMALPTRSWIDYTNARKTHRAETRDLENATKATPIEHLAERKTVKLPKPTGSSPRQGNILYTEDVDRIRKLARGMGRYNMSYREVGQRSFNYAYERLVLED